VEIDDLLSVLETAQVNEANWLKGVCPKCQGDGCEYPHRADGSYLPPIDCSYCGGTGNIAEYVETLCEDIKQLREENDGLRAQLRKDAIVVNEGEFYFDGKEIGFLEVRGGTVHLGMGHGTTT